MCRERSQAPFTGVHDGKAAVHDELGEDYMTYFSHDNGSFASAKRDPKTAATSFMPDCLDGGWDRTRSHDEEMLETIVAFVQRESKISKGAAIRALVRMLDGDAAGAFEY